MQIGRRIIYDNLTGEIVYQEGEMQGGVFPRKELNGVTYIDLPYGAYYTEFITSKLVGIDVVTKLPIFEPLAVNLNEAKSLKIQQIKLQCQEVIVQGFNSTVKYNETHHYSLSDYQRENMKDQEDKLNNGVILNALWHYDGVVQHDIWTKAEFLQLCYEKDTFILQTRLYSDSLEKLVDSAATVGEINAVVWGMLLPQEELDYNNSLLTAMQIQVQV